jgi:hypothetical protein
MGNVKKKDDGNVPVSVLHQIGEHTIGGFALFYFNAETGLPQHVLCFDTPAHCLAMQKHMTDWNNALQTIYLEGMKENIRSSFHDGSKE